MPDNRKAFSDNSQSTVQGGGIVIPLRRSRRPNGKTGSIPTIDPEREPVWLHDQQYEKTKDEKLRYHTLTNIIGLVVITILVGTGVWLAHAIAEISVRTG